MWRTCKRLTGREITQQGLAEEIETALQKGRNGLIRWMEVNVQQRFTTKNTKDTKKKQNNTESQAVGIEMLGISKRVSEERLRVI